MSHDPGSLTVLRERRAMFLVSLSPVGLIGHAIVHLISKSCSGGASAPLELLKGGTSQGRLDEVGASVGGDTIFAFRGWLPTK